MKTQMENLSNIEMFFDIIDESALILYNYYSRIYNNFKEESLYRNYIDVLTESIENILEGEIFQDGLNTEEMNRLNELYSNMKDQQFSREEIRKAIQLAILKGIKHLHISNTLITPDSIGILFSYFIDKLFYENDKIDICDTTVGSGNLLFTVLNNIKTNHRNLYGIDINYSQIKLALSLAELLDYNIEFHNKSAIQNQYFPQVDLMIGDLPVDNINEIDLKNVESYLINKEIQYLPYFIIEQNFKYVKNGGYLIYLIPNDFFEHQGSNLIKEIILSKSYIQSIIALPDSLFKKNKFGKSIFILQKKGENVVEPKEIFIMNLSSIIDDKKVKNVINRFNLWHSENK